MAQGRFTDLHCFTLEGQSRNAVPKKLLAANSKRHHILIDVVPAYGRAEAKAFIGYGEELSKENGFPISSRDRQMLIETAEPIFALSSGTICEIRIQEVSS